MHIQRTSSLLIAALSYSQLWSQCQITTNATDTEITCGSCVSLIAFGNGTGNIAFAEDFNIGVPLGWQFTQSAQFDNPCSPNGVDGTPHLWMGPASPNPRTMATTPLDLSLGGYICFDMLFAEQGDDSPCEGPDEPQEGVFLQYSVDNGATWITINYFDPNGGNDPQLTNWNNWCFTLPPGAVTPTTMIRWHQDDVTDNTYDHWGIDNVEITLNDPNFGITWEHDGYEYGLGVPGGTNPNEVCPQETTTYTANVSDGITTCTSSITITVNEPVIILTAGADSTICEGGCVTLDAEGYHLVSPASTPTFENNEFGLVAGGTASVNINVQGLNTTTLVDGSITQVCINGFTVFGGASPCFDFGGCPCNGGTIGFGEICDLTTGSFDVFLTSPGGCQIQLVPDGISTDGYANTCFVPAGGTPIGPGFPVGGTWDPEEPISGLNGCDANGVWTLSFEGPGGLSLGIGTLTGWNISFDDPEITEPVDFEWTPLDNMTDEDTFSPTVCPSGTATYTLTATDLAGCITVSDDVTISIETCCALEVLAFDAIAPGCNTDNGSIIITDLAGESGTVTYALDNAPPQSSAEFTDLGPGTYMITVNDDIDCPVTVEVVLEPSDGPDIVSIGSTPPSCATDDGTLSVVANGSGLEYSFDGGLTFGPLADVSGLSSGDYSIIVTDAGGCSVDTLISLTPLDGPEILDATGIDPVCGALDGSITISGSADAVSFSIDGGSTFEPTNSFTDLGPGTYSIAVADAAGCTATGSVELLNNPPPVITDIQVTDPLCGAQDGSIVVNTNANAVQFSIDGGATLQPSGVFDGLAQGSYTITVVDGQGCTTEETILLATADGPELTSIATITASCGNADGSITILATGTGLTYSIDGGVTFGTDAVSSDVAAGTYTIVVLDDAGCTATGNAIVDEQTGPVIDDVTTTPAGCNTSDGSLIITASGPGLSFSIDGGANYQAGNVFAGLPGGDYDIIVLSGACTAEQSVTVAEGPGPGITNVVTSSPGCAGGSDGSIVIESTGTGALEYTINGGAPQPSPSFPGLAAGTYSVSVSSQPGGCSTEQEIILIDPTPIALVLEATPPSCAGDCNGTATAAVQGGTGDLTYLWTGNVAPDVEADASDLCSGEFTVIVSDENGCTVDTSFVLVEPAPFVIGSIAETGETCAQACDGTILVQADGAILYSLDGGTPQPAALFENVCPGTYTLETVDSNGCSAMGMATIAEGEDVSAGFEPSPRTTNVFTPRFLFTNTSEGATSHAWDFGGFGTSTELSPGFQFPEESGQIEVCLTATNDSTGCSDTFCTTVFILADNSIHVPNTFTPDGDGINDVFFAVGDVSLAQNFTLLIHNRWGELIYTSTDMFEGWDGTSGGVVSQDGVYIWTIDVQDPQSAEIRRYQGHVSLLR